MNWFKKIFLCIVYAVMLLVCSAALFAGSLVFIGPDFQGFPASRWSELGPWIMYVALLTGQAVLRHLWYVLLLFGGWASFFPPRRWWAYAAFSFVAAMMGVWASWCIELNREPEPPVGPDEVLPPIQLRFDLTLQTCVVAVVSTALCYFLLRRWYQQPPPNHALQRTASDRSAPGGSR